MKFDWDVFWDAIIILLWVIALILLYFTWADLRRPIPFDVSHGVQLE